ncbi:hypothetical protein, partial [Methylobacterium sp. WL8]|uniref:hypothetical protein n=1 Tax=Methylobacterium sp. WL8 TaxID=2603899 RepID=UPI001AEF021D
AQPRPADPSPSCSPPSCSPQSCPVEEIARAYLLTSAGDADLALRCVIADALSDLLESDRRARERSRLISRGYVRGRDG